jgi:hypothetical protein
MHLLTVRYGLPLGLFLLGIVFLIIQPGSTGLEGFCGATGAALALLLLNVLFRTGVAGDRDREREEAARLYFDEHGYWPDEAPAKGARTDPEPPRSEPEPGAPRPLRDAARPAREPVSPQREPRREGGRRPRPRPSRRP